MAGVLRTDPVLPVKKKAPPVVGTPEGQEKDIIRGDSVNTYLVYFDETGDDGSTTSSSDHFLLTSIYMDVEKWMENFSKLKDMRKELRERFGMHIAEEMHTKEFLTDKGPYRKYNWTIDERQEILKTYTRCVASLDISVINVIIDKTKITTDNYPVLENALTYNIQRIENDSNGRWRYIILSDGGRIRVMIRAARKIRAFNPIPSQFSPAYTNHPIQYMVEDILEKDSKESYFIQACDFISYFAHLYFSTQSKGKELPNRVARVIDKSFVGSVFATFKAGGILNLKANAKHPYGFVVYPR